jgi:hypothetical protein
MDLAIARTDLTMCEAENEGRDGVVNYNHCGPVHDLYTSAHSVKLEVKKS